MMRGRQRHFNARDAGASLVLDSRFIAGVSINGPISTWLDRSRNGYSATSTGTMRPTLQISASGVPVVRTDGVDDNMDIPIGPTVSTIAGHFLLAAVKQITFPSMWPNILSLKTNEPNNWAVSHSYGHTSYNWILIGSAGSFARARWTGDPDTNLHLITVGYNGNGSATLDNWALWVDGVGKQLTNAGLFANSQQGAKVAQDGTMFGNNDYSQIVLINSDISAPLRKRIERSSAYSFRNACQ